MTTETREWAVLATVTHELPAADRQAVEGLADGRPHLTIASRIPGGQWAPLTSPDEPASYVFLVEGDLTVGTLDDYAKHWERAHYSGGDISTVVKNWAGASFIVRVEHLGTDEDLWMRHRLSIGDQTAFVTLDGRA